ncbi:MAG TPA: DUF4332 domain-containing protein [Ardenticatenaceae bacterium]
MNPTAPYELTAIDSPAAELFLALHYELKVPKELLSPFLKIDEGNLVSVIAQGNGLALLPGFVETIDVESEAQYRYGASPEKKDANSALETLKLLAPAALEKFRRQTATPEQRLTIAKKFGFSYEELTNYVIRADLQRLKSMTPKSAEFLALAGVIGVYDLASRRERESRKPPKAQVIKLKPERRARELERGLLKSAIKQALISDSASRERETLSDLLTKSDELEVEELRRQLKEVLGAGEGDKGKDSDWRLDEFPLGNLNLLIQEAREHAQQQPPQVVTATEVIVVVKGAGLQKADETLDTFINGFWPAVKYLDPRAIISQKNKPFPPDYPAPDGEEAYNRVTEIQTGERRIWLKESHWEAAIRPLSPFAALGFEWQMARHAFGSLLYEFVSPDDSAKRKDDDPQDYWRLVFTYHLQYFLYLLLLSWALWGRIPIGNLDPRALPTLGVLALGSFIVAWVAALIVGRHLHQIKQRRPRERETTPLDITLWVLLLALIANPIRYLLVLTALMLFQTLMLLVRDIAWPYRERFNSDTDRSEPYVREVGANGVRSHGTLQVFRRENQREKYFISAALYRFIVVLGVPLVFIVHLITTLLRLIGRLIPGVGDFALNIESVVSKLLSGGLGDVAGYSNDPSQAQRIRSVIQRDIEFFHQQPHINHIHVFAHSQGTPITFETLFHYLPDFFRTKIKSYVTIGSVLSYYHQSQPVLDRLFIPRFPTIPYPHFAEGFRWMNFWNSNDPITEFFALDEFDLFEAPTTMPADASDVKPVRSSRSPTNIRTGGHVVLTSSHSEYWHNLWDVQVPLALRVMGDWDPEEWRLINEAEWATERATPRRRFSWLPKSHFAFVVAMIAVVWMALIAVLWLPWILIHRLTDNNVVIANAVRWLQGVDEYQIPLIEYQMSVQRNEVAGLLVFLALFAIFGLTRPVMAAALRKLLFEDSPPATTQAKKENESITSASQPQQLDEGLT